MPTTAHPLPQGGGNTAAPPSPFALPTGYFGIVLGLGALSLAWQHAQAFWAQAAMVSNMLGAAACACWLLMMAAFGVKLARFAHHVRAEWRHPVQFAFIGLIPITTIVVGDIGLRWLGTAGQILFAFVRVAPLWKGNFCEQAVLPPFYLPLVAANFSSAAGMGLLGHTDLGYLFLGAGMVAWISYEPIILQRMRVFAGEAQIRPTMGIVLAPAFVGTAAYLSLNGGQVDLFAKMLWGYGLLQLMFLLRVLPWILVQGFTLGLWAFSFGLASMVGASVAFYAQTSLRPLAAAAFWLGNLAIAVLLLGTLLRVAQGRFLLRPAPG